MKKIICILLILCLLVGCGATAQTKPVLTCTDADYTLRCDQFQYYFCFQYANTLETLGADAFDPAQNLDAQRYDDTQSWKEFLIGESMTLAEQTARLCLAAREAGFTLPQADQLGDLDAIVAQTAKDNGYSGAAEYLTAYYGEGATIDGYREFLENMALASAYSEHLNTSLKYTDAEIEAFYDSRAADYADIFDVPKNYDRQMDVRMIRFYPNDPGSEADWRDAEARAQAALEAFLQDPSDEAFAVLADARTEDYHSPDGGLYAQVCPNQMNDKLNEWLYPKDTLRAVGDCDWVDDGDACVLCYISAVNEKTYWMTVAENDLRYADYIALLNEIDGRYTFERIPENVNLRVPTAHTAANAVSEGTVAVG